MNNNWNKHYQNIKQKNLEPSATLAKAIDLFDKEQVTLQIATDLGCGTGIDTLALIENGWQVIAIDNQSQAIKELRIVIPEKYTNKVSLIEGNFETMALQNVLLVNASFSLPFCNPEKFSDLWQKIIQSIFPNGRFAGHFFGINDSWASDTRKTFHTKEQILKLFTGFEIEYFEEVEKVGKCIDEKEKIWHVFHIVAKKN